jgi:hypothetical protein
MSKKKIFSFFRHSNSFRVKLIPIAFIRGVGSLNALNI